MLWNTKITRKSFKAFTTRGYKTFPLYVVAVIKRWCYRHMTMSLLAFKKFHILCVKAQTPSHWSSSNIPPWTTHSQTFIKRSRFWSDPLWNQLRYSPGPEGECWQLHGDEVFSPWVVFWSSTIAESLTASLCSVTVHQSGPWMQHKVWGLCSLCSWLRSHSFISSDFFTSRTARPPRLRLIQKLFDFCFFL